MKKTDHRLADENILKAWEEETDFQTFVLKSEIFMTSLLAFASGLVAILAVHNSMDYSRFVLHGRNEELKKIYEHSGIVAGGAWLLFLAIAVSWIVFARRLFVMGRRFIKTKDTFPQSK